MGLIEMIDDDLSEDALELRYRRNPLEYVNRVVFEYTSRCNLRCRHCYNGQVESCTETQPGLLRQSADAFLFMGVQTGTSARCGGQDHGK